MSEQAMTVSQAIAEGYERWGYDGEDFQFLKRLDDVSDDDFKYALQHSKPILLADKNPSYLSVTAQDIKDSVIDDICCDNDRHDDTDIVPDALSEMPGWDEFAEKINVVLKNHPYWYLTKIQLVPDGK